MRCRLPGSSRTITLRVPLFDQVPGQILTVAAKKHWRHNGHPYLSGTIVSSRADAAAMRLPPLALEKLPAWDPADAGWGKEAGPLEDWAKAILARGPRPAFEMERVVPGRSAEDFGSDPVLEAQEMIDAEEFGAAQEILIKLFEADVRCLDAHEMSGSLILDSSPSSARPHFEVGVQIGEFALGNDFEGFLPWGLPDNRPFLRCMRGLGLCLWRQTRWEEAECVFERLMWLNPLDGQGNHGLLCQVRSRVPWSSVGAL